MTSAHKIRNHKLQGNIDKEAAKISPLLSGKTDKCEYHPEEKILHFNRSQITEQEKKFQTILKTEYF